MSNTHKHKVPHLFWTEDGNLNLNIPRKLRWSCINRWRRHNYDRDEERASRSRQKRAESERDMRQQINDI